MKSFNLDYRARLKEQIEHFYTVTSGDRLM